MIAVADSGSTKTDWLFFDKTGEFSVQTGGVNPIIQTKEEILLQLSPLQKVHTAQVTHVYFYGAGCSSSEYQQKVIQALQRHFPQANVQVEHDLLGAARALYDSQPVIACILGTGSNSCYYDGKTIEEKVPALGYVLGDEGSGAHIGKELLRRYFYQLLDNELHDKFEKWLKLSKKEIFDKVYRAPSPNRFLASLAEFAGENAGHPLIQSLLEKVFNEFVNIHIQCFEDYRSVPVGFVGSVAFYFQPVLKEVLKQNELTVGRIIRRPVEGLKNYHLKDLQV